MKTKNLKCLNKVWEEFIKMKHNYDRLKKAQIELRKTALEQSSLDNLIKASFNPIGGSRPRLDSLQDIREEKFGRKRAMTIDGSIKEKYVPIKTSKNSAFSSYKNTRWPAVIQRNTKDTEEEFKDANIGFHELKINRKRTHQQVQNDFHIQSSELLLSPHEHFSGRKRAKSH